MSNKRKRPNAPRARICNPPACERITLRSMCARCELKRLLGVGTVATVAQCG